MLADIDHIKLALGIEGSDRDALIELVGAGVSAGIEQFLGDTIGRTTYTETLSASGSWDALVLAHGPILDVETFTLDGDAIAATDYTVESESRILRKLLGDWSGARNLYVVTYEAGFETVPQEIQLAALQETVHRFREFTQGRTGLTSQTDQVQAAQSFDTHGLLPSVRQLLQGRRRFQ